MDETNDTTSTTTPGTTLLGTEGKDGTWEREAATWAKEKAEAQQANDQLKAYLRGKPLHNQKVKGATKLSKVAPRIFAAIRANPPEWMPEFDQFIRQTFGARPNGTFRAVAADQWDAAIMGALFSWSYFNEMLTEAGPEQIGEAAPEVPAEAVVADASGPVADVAPAAEAEPASAEVEPVAGSGTGDVPAAEHGAGVLPSLVVDSASDLRPTFALLGPDGELLVEGIR